MPSISRALFALALPLAWGVPNHGGPLTDTDLADIDTYVRANKLPFTVGRNPATERPMSELCGLVPPSDAPTSKSQGIGKVSAGSTSQDPVIGAKGGSSGSTGGGRTATTTTTTAAAATPSPSPSPAVPSPSPDNPSPSPWSFPTAFDWRDHMSVVPPIKNQGSCGACWAFAIVGQLEMLTAINNAVVNDFSEQYLVSCSKQFGYTTYSCTGGFYYAHNDHNQQQSSTDGHWGGVRSETCYPYAAQDSTCDWTCSGIDTVTGWQYVDPANYVNPSNEVIKNAIYYQGPVAVTVYASSTFQSYTGGIYTTTTTATSPNHGVVLIGWGVDPVVGEYWIVRNSWGSGWGEKGYMRIKFGESLIGGYANYATHPSGAPVVRDVAEPASISPTVAAPGAPEAGPSITWVAVGIAGVVAIVGIGLGFLCYQLYVQRQRQKAEAIIFIPGSDPESPPSLQNMQCTSPQWMAKLTPGAPCNTRGNYSPLPSL